MKTFVSVCLQPAMTTPRALPRAAGGSLAAALLLLSLAVATCIRGGETRRRDATLDGPPPLVARTRTGRAGQPASGRVQDPGRVSRKSRSQSRVRMPSKTRNTRRHLAQFPKQPLLPSLEIAFIITIYKRLDLI